jgi:hypothetical protein
MATSLYPGSKKTPRPRSVVTGSRDGNWVDTYVYLADGRRITGWYDVRVGSHVYFQHPDDPAHWRKVCFNVEGDATVPYEVVDGRAGFWLQIDFRPEGARG